MKKITMLAAVLAMTMFAAVPALANDDDDNNGTDQSIETVQVTAAEFGDQSIEQNVIGDDNELAAINNQQQFSSQTVQNAQADDGSLAFNADDLFFEDDDFFFWGLF